MTDTRDIWEGSHEEAFISGVLVGASVAGGLFVLMLCGIFLWMIW